MRVAINYPREGVNPMAQDLQALNVQNKMVEWTARTSEHRSSGQSVKSWCQETQMRYFSKCGLNLRFP